MTQRLLPTLSLLLLLAAAAGATAQEATEETAPVRRDMAIMDYGDYTVKAYTVSFSGGFFSGGTYLDNQLLDTRTRITEPNREDVLGPNDVLGYDGLPLLDARKKRLDGLRYLYEGARKEIKPGPAFGARLGIYIADAFHLDVHGSYAQGKAQTSMVYMGQTDTDPNRGQRVVLDEDDGFSVLMGGLSLMYDARPATFWGITPRLGFGLGGVINSYTELEDKTSLYLEGSFGLTRPLASNVDIFAQADVATFAFEVDELGYANMVNYTTLSAGISWFFDVLPPEVRAAHEAEAE